MNPNEPRDRLLPPGKKDTIMSFTDDELNALCQGMEQEIDAYRRLAGDLKEEADSLRLGAIDALIKVVQRIEEHTASLQEIRASLQTTVEMLLDKMSKKEDRSLEGLLAALPPSYRGKLRSHQKTLGQFREWVRQLNEKNKLYVQDHRPRRLPMR
jgi:hypothetical protein